jgi:hypothetical protein
MSIRIGYAAILTLLLAACGSGGDDASPAANQAPIAAADSASTRPGVAVDLDLLANDTDADGDSLRIELPEAQSSVTFLVVSGTRLRVTPSAGFSGTVTFTYRAFDSRAAYSAPTPVTLTVGVDLRAMIVVGSTLAFDTPRAVIGGSAPGIWRPLVDFPFSGCAQSPFAAFPRDGRRLFARRCLSPTRQDVLLSLPRATVLAAPTVVYGNAALANGMLVSANFDELLLAERVTNPDDLALPASYDLIRVDVAQRAVVERFTLPDVDLVSSIQPGGGSRRAYVLARDTAGDHAYFLVDLAARSVVRVTGPGPMPVSAEDSLPSPDGRFLVYHWNITNDLRGFDAQAPGPERVLWSAPAAPGSFVTDKQWIEGGGATLLVRVQNFFNYTATFDTSLWVVPLGAPSQAREVVSFR